MSEILNPFSAENSSYMLFENGTITPSADVTDIQIGAHQQLRDLVLQPKFACIGAQAALSTGSYAFGAYEDITSPNIAEGVCHDIHKFSIEFGLEEMKATQKIKFATFIAAFLGPHFVDELHAVESFYTLLSQMKGVDRKKSFLWSPDVSSDVNSNDFSFSIGGNAFFVPLIHKFASISARKSELTLAVFNPHILFENLKAHGKFEALKQKIRNRQPEIHPDLGDHGSTSEFDQYALVSSHLKQKANEILHKIMGPNPF